MKKLKYTKQVLQEAIKEAICISDVCRYINGSDRHVHGGLHNYISKKIKELKLNTSHFKSQSEVIVIRNKERHLTPKNKRFAKDLLKLNRGYIAHAHQIRAALLEIGVPYICKICGNDGTWNGVKLTLEIDHINGIRADDRKSNLRFLCPNCHSQTKNYRSKNRKSKA